VAHHFSGRCASCRRRRVASRRRPGSPSNSRRAARCAAVPSPRPAPGCARPRRPRPGANLNPRPAGAVVPVAADADGPRTVSPSRPVAGTPRAGVSGSRLALQARRATLASPRRAAGALGEAMRSFVATRSRCRSRARRVAAPSSRRSRTSRAGMGRRIPSRGPDHLGLSFGSAALSRSSRITSGRRTGRKRPSSNRSAINAAVIGRSSSSSGRASPARRSPRPRMGSRLHTCGIASTALPSAPARMSPDRR